MSARVACLFALIAGAGCSGADGVSLHLTFDDGLALDRVTISGVIDGDEAFAPGTLPDPPRALAAAGETFGLLVADTLAGRTVLVHLDGQDGEDVVAVADVEVAIEDGRIVREDQAH